MTIKTNYNDSIKVTENETETTIGYLNGTLNENKSFTLNANVTNYDLYSANKESVKAQINTFIEDVMDNIDNNFKAVEMENTNAESEE